MAEACQTHRGASETKHINHKLGVSGCGDPAMLRETPANDTEEEQRTEFLANARSAAAVSGSGP